MVFFFIAFIISKLFPAVEKDPEEKKPTARRELHELIVSLAFKKNVLTHMYFPKVEGDGSVSGSFFTEECVVTPGGVLLITACTYGGNIENNRDPWISRKDDVTIEFSSPAAAGADCRVFMDTLIRKGGIRGVPVYSLTVMTDPTASLLLTQDNVIPSGDLDSVMKSLKSSRDLDLAKQYVVRKLLRTLGKKEKRAKAAHSKTKK